MRPIPVALCLVSVSGWLWLASEPISCVPVMRYAPRAWSPRDSHTAVRFQGRFWLFGGWEDSGRPNLRDVWVSTDARQWKKTAQDLPFPQADLQASVQHGERLYLLGGWADGRMPGAFASDEVWSTGDGHTWRRETDRPGRAWSPRVGAAAVSFKDRIWMLGGVGDYHHALVGEALSDVWASRDGREWELVTEQAPWPGRAFHVAVVFDDHLYVMGGGNYRDQYFALADVWRSADGIEWERLPQPPWGRRIWHTTAVLGGHLYVLGGWTDNPPTNLGDAWRTADGIRWEEVPLCPRRPLPHASPAVVDDGRILQFGGATDRLVNEVFAWSPDRRVVARGWRF